MRNLFCQITDIDSEADVEVLVVEKLIGLFGHPANRIHRKDSLDKITIARGQRKELFRPDYVLLDRKKKPSFVLDAKSPNESPEDYRYQVGGYAYALNLKYPEENPVRHVVVTNGLKLVLWEWDSETPVLELGFEDFDPDNPSFIRLRTLLSYGASDVIRATEKVFKFEPPELDYLLRTFDKCHNIIRKHGLGPTPAFYAFAKLIFVKVREDNRIGQMIASDIHPAPGDFNFSVKWIQDQVTRGVSDNPVNDILFANVRTDLENRISQGKTKRIFDPGEEIDLPNDTIIQVVEELQHFDLRSIDEDLNGRMFEKFLNATVRGRELGQFFTPRSVVKYMVSAAGLSVHGDSIPRVLDGCCGSGGFLIEAMAALSHTIDTKGGLSGSERKQLKMQLYMDCLYGVDKSQTIARVARLNMYLHGDGGSKIFSTDMLDHDLPLPTGLSTEIQDEIQELREHLTDNDMCFDVVLTNPPFSMTYKSSNVDEKRILAQYKLGRNLSGALSQSEQSNVLFIERYYNLLKNGGQLFTIIDNTVLNGSQSQKYRDYILDRFIIRQIISLPFNTFARAQAGVQTSMLHLTKREEGSGDEQGAAILNNIGHDNHQRETQSRDNTRKLLDAYQRWKTEGTIDEICQLNTDLSETLGCPFQVFSVPASEINRKRLDAMYYAPELRRLQQSLRSNENVRIHPGKSLEIIKQISEKDELAFHGQLFKYVDIGNVTKDGAIASYREDIFENLPKRARMLVREGDVLFARLRTSRGTALIVPKEFDGELFTNGFIAVRPSSEEERLLLWSLFVSDVFSKQVYYLAVTAAQSEIRPEIIDREFVLPIPTGKMKNDIVREAKQVFASQQHVRIALATARKMNWEMAAPIT